MAKLKDNFTIRGRLVDDPKLVIRPNKKNPSEPGWTLVNFSIAKNLNDQHGSVVFYKFAAWNKPEKGGFLATEIANCFKKGDWIGIVRSVPAIDTCVCRKCKTRTKAYNAFTVYEIDGYDLMALDEKEDKPDNELQEEISLLLEDDDVY